MTTVRAGKTLSRAARRGVGCVRPRWREAFVRPDHPGLRRQRAVPRRARAGPAAGLGGDRSVVVAHVIPRPPPYDARTKEYVKLVRHHDHAVLDPALEALAGLRVEARPIESGSPRAGLHELVEDEGASLIVIGSTHRGPVGRVVLGSVGEILLAGTPAAVAVAPKGFAAGCRRNPDRDRGLQAGPEGRAALRAAASLASELGAKLRAIAVKEGFARARHAPSTSEERALARGGARPRPGGCAGTGCRARREGRRRQGARAGGGGLRPDRDRLAQLWAAASHPPRQRLGEADALLAGAVAGGSPRRRRGSDPPGPAPARQAGS